MDLVQQQVVILQYLWIFQPPSYHLYLLRVGHQGRSRQGQFGTSRAESNKGEEKIGISNSKLLL